MRIVLLLAIGVLTSACGAIAPTSVPTPTSAPIGMPTATATTGPLFTQSEAISLVQGYLRTKTYTVYYSVYSTERFGSPSRYEGQRSEVRQCAVGDGEWADWKAVYQQGTWVVTREIDLKAREAYLEDLLGMNLPPYMSSDEETQVDMWALDEHTRLVERLVPDNVSYARREC